MKKGSTLFLKVVLFCMGIPVLAACIAGAIQLVRNPANPEYAPLLYPAVVLIYITVIPFIMALVQSFSLLGLIDRQEAFSDRSVMILKKIKRYAFTVCCMYIAAFPFVFMVADKDDAPGLILVGLVPIFASLVIAVFAAVLQKLLREAIFFKTENDLTV
ncbi:DUF2975 domain-containing protein [Rossellomorea marisflavi]|uniref:DUF2975 domain-containing protein n=1 Tax=Rossellomorea marisflavi TaxID=189381 RepID=UPI003457570B